MDDGLSMDNYDSNTGEEEQEPPPPGALSPAAKFPKFLPVRLN